MLSLFGEPIIPLCSVRLRRTKLDPTCICFDDVCEMIVIYVAICFFFCSNLCVFRLIVVTTYVYNNFCFVSTYMYECMIDFVCSIYILYVQQIMCITNFVFSNFSLNVWQLLFLWQFVYEIMCMTTYFFFTIYVRHLISVTTHVYDRFYF